MTTMEFKVDLNNCDREPIHIPGKIQPHGVLIGLDKRSLIITHCSGNTADFFALNPSEILDQPFSRFLSQAGIESQDNNIIGFVHHRLVKTDGENALIVSTKDNKEYYLIISDSSAQTVLVEIEPVITETVSSSQTMVEGILTKILGARSLQETLEWSAQQVKEIIGYDRVMIYKFAEDGHGEVIAEAVNDDLEKFLGLHYPASDIPRQARELYKRNLVRIIADVDATDAPIEANNEITKETPLDLTDSVLRAVSPIHIQYLKNMGVRASFSVSLLTDGELWGLIACHNYSPSLVDYKKRNSCKFIGQLLSTSLVFRETEESKEEKINLRERMLDIIRLVRTNWDIPPALTNPANNLLHITNATGAAFIYEEKVYTLGDTPEEEDILNLAQWLHHHSKNQVYQTSHLSKDYPAAYKYKEVASGLLSCAISRELNEYIFWFKKEMVQTVKWAGNPEKPTQVSEDGVLSLSPRRSFDVWTQEVVGVSQGWHNNEIGVAMKFREELLHIVNERANQIRKLNEQLKQAYDELDTFSFTISHDLKTPLSSIKNYAELILDNDEMDWKQAKPMLEKIVRGADKMNMLIKEVLSYSRIGRQHIKPEMINMDHLLEEIKTEQLTAYKHISPIIKILACPNINGDKTMLYQVFSNIIGNAVKYSSGHDQPQVTVTAAVNASDITYTIVDNGIGIDMQYGDQIFDLFKRMSNADKYEGTGVGLAIVKRIIEKHRARIWYDSEPGRGTTFFVRFKNEQYA